MLRTVVVIDSDVVVDVSGIGCLSCGVSINMAKFLEKKAAIIGVFAVVSAAVRRMRYNGLAC